MAVFTVGMGVAAASALSDEAVTDLDATDSELDSEEIIGQTPDDFAGFLPKTLSKHLTAEHSTLDLSHVPHWKHGFINSYANRQLFRDSFDKIPQNVWDSWNLAPTEIQSHHASECWGRAPILLQRVSRRVQDGRCRGVRSVHHDREH